MHAFADVTRVLVAGYLITMMFSIGLELGGGPKEDKATKRHQRHLLVLGLVFNLVLLPLLAFLLVRASGSSGHVTTAFLLLAAAPGGRFAPHFTRMAGGNVSLSVEITIFLAKLLSFTAPVTARLMLHSGHIELSELRAIAQLLVLQLLPYLAGKWVRKHHRATAEKLDPPLQTAALMFVVSAFAVVLFSHDLRGIWTLTGERGWLPVIAFAPLAIGLGSLLGGSNAETRRTFAISGNARDLAFGAMLGSLIYGDHTVLLATFLAWVLLTSMGVSYVVLVRRLTRRAIPTRA